MANKNTTDLIDDLVADIVENTQGLISANLLRGRIIDIIQSRGLFEVYVGTKKYEQNESIVFTDNNIYRCLILTAAGENPTTTPSKWKKTADLIDELNPTLGADLDSDNNRILESQGDDIASVNNITLESTLNGNTYVITGTTQINLIETLDWHDGAGITLQFTGILKISNGVVASGDFAPIHLAKGSDYTTSPNDTLSFKLINGEWFEISNTKEVDRVTIVSSATPTPTGGARENELYITALAVNAVFAAPTGTPADGNNIMIWIDPTVAVYTLAFNAAYNGFSEDLPSTTITNKAMVLNFIYRTANSKYNLVAVVNEA